MARAQVWGLLAAIVVCVCISSGVVAQNDSSQNGTLPATKVAHLDSAKYNLPLPANASVAAAVADAANATLTHNKTIASTMPTANYWDLQQNPKYNLPVPSKNATVANGAAEGARIESAAAPSPTVSSTESQASDSAKIESVPGFVRTQGQNFVLNGKAAYFAGTNAW